VALFSKGDYEAACARFEASLKLFPGLGTRGKLAECYERLGRYASAWQVYREVAQLAARSGDATREQVASERARSLEPKLSYVTVVVPPGRDVPGLLIKRGGHEVERKMLGAAEPVDAGATVFEISAPGRRTATGQVTAAPGQAVTFEVPVLAPLEAATSPPPSPPPQPSSPEPALVQRDPPSWQKPLGLVLAGAGVIGVGASAVVGLSARSTYDGAFVSGGCDRATRVCDAPGQGTIDDARSKATLATVLFGAGGALVLVGAVVYLTAPTARSHAIRLSPTPYAGGAGLSLGGAL
jgi:hypothetical protein